MSVIHRHDVSALVERSLGFNALMETCRLAGAAEVEAALLNPSLVPPAPPDSLRPGPTAELRAAMARFSGGDSHGTPRRSVECLLGSLAHHPFSAEAHRRTVELLRLDPNKTAAADVAFVVPTDTMASALGVAESDLASVRLDVLRMVEVIGRQQPSTDESDAAVVRVTARVENLGHDAVAALSVLYQAHDASAALFNSMLSAEQTATHRSPAVATTIRTATEAVTIGRHDVDAGTTVTIDLEPGFEFGAGAHTCPGRGIAERIVAGMLEAVRSVAP